MATVPITAAPCDRLAGGGGAEIGGRYTTSGGRGGETGGLKTHSGEGDGAGR